MTQIVGKVRLAHCAPENHWWHTSLRFCSTGLTTTPIAYRGGSFEIVFDFVDHALRITTHQGEQRIIALEPRSVADFYSLFFRELAALNVNVSIWPVPVEIPDPVPFRDDVINNAYDHEKVSRMWSILSNVHDVFSQSRNEFLGKSSPVHFFWGAFDVALTRFSGRLNQNPPQDRVMSEAYSHEVISHGFWFGGDWPTGGRIPEPVFYAYALPEPPWFQERHRAARCCKI